MGTGPEEHCRLPAGDGQQASVDVGRGCAGRGRGGQIRGPGGRGRDFVLTRREEGAAGWRWADSWGLTHLFKIFYFFQ